MSTRNDRREGGRSGGRAQRVSDTPPADNAVGDSAVDAVDNSGEQARSAVPTTGSDGAELQGSDLARAALAAAREQSKARGARSKPTVRSGPKRRRRGWSGSGVDDRDPQSLGKLAARLASDRGWSDHLAGGRVFGEWNTLVGGDVAEHTKPVALNDGELTVQAESTAWATQLRLLQRQILKKIADGVGNDVVRKIKVQGPAAPSWRHGPRHVSGRGPRDTYG